jgi:hypothetical protein
MLNQIKSGHPNPRSTRLGEEMAKIDANRAKTLTLDPFFSPNIQLRTYRHRVGWNRRHSGLALER